MNVLAKNTLRYSKWKKAVNFKVERWYSSPDYGRYVLTKKEFGFILEILAKKFSDTVIQGCVGELRPGSHFCPHPLVRTSVNLAESQCPHLWNWINGSHQKVLLWELIEIRGVRCLSRDRCSGPERYSHPEGWWVLVRLWGFHWLCYCSMTSDPVLSKKIREMKAGLPCS